jgi:hypothetical protein
MRARARIGVGGLVLAGLAAGLLSWWSHVPQEARVRKTIVTTVQNETPASFYVTGTMEMTATVSVDSSALFTPGWLTLMLRTTNPAVVPLARGSATATIRVPGRVSYGFPIQALTPDKIEVGDDGRIGVALPVLRIHSVEPDLAQLQMKTETAGWMRLFASGAPTEVRDRALASVEQALRRQAETHLRSATQPRTNTARALASLLTPPLQAAGMNTPQFRIRIGDDLVLAPHSSAP